MPRRPVLLLVLACGLAASACDRLLKPADKAGATEAGPPDELTLRAVESLLPGLRFGANEAADTYREVRSVRIAGSHFTPASNRWVVHYCVDFTSFAGDEVRRRCDLNVQLYQLDSGDWVGFASGVGTIYRWQVLGTTATPATAPAPVEPAGESMTKPGPASR